MNRYFCPYCNPKYQFSKQLDSGRLICSICGEDLVKKPYISLKQIVSLIVFTSLLIPLIYSLIILIMQEKNRPKINSQAIEYSLIYEIKI